MAQLFPGEVVVRTSPATWVGVPTPRQGTLTLTNRALIFDGPVPVQPPGGGPPAPSAGPPQLEEGERRFPLWRCQGAKVSPGQVGPRLEVDLLQRVVFFRTAEPQQWASAINQARASAPPAPPGAVGTPGGAPSLEARRAAMPKCAYCGNLNPPMATHCKTCGAPLG
jgi:ribosomal protein L40E